MGKGNRIGFAKLQGGRTLGMLVYKGVSPSSIFARAKSDPLIHGFVAIHPHWSNDWPHQVAHILFVSESPYVSCSRHQEIAQIYAGTEGRVYRIRLPEKTGVIFPAQSLAVVRKEFGELGDAEGLAALERAIRKARRDLRF